MWNSFMKLRRIEKALEYNKSSFIDIRALFDLLVKRGVTDRKLNNLAWQLVCWLEPPGCEMGHCKHYGGQDSFCNCGMGRVPGRCKIHREYRKRQAARQQKVKEE